jgi:hypothetical protein
MIAFGFFEALIAVLMGIVSLGIPVATLVLAILIYRNTRKR